MNATRRFWLIWIGIAFVALVIVQAPRWLAYGSFLTDPMQIAGDARQWILPYLQSDYLRDYASTYYRDQFMPAGLDWFYRHISSIGNLDVIARYFGLLLLVATVAMAGAACWTLAGPWASLACMSYMVSTAAVTELTLHALPRSYSLPLLAASLWTASRRRWGGMAFITVLAAFISPVASVLSGLWMAGCMLTQLRMDGAWRMVLARRQLLWVGLTALLCMTALLAPGRWHSDTYGALITPSMVGEYPEVGFTGRYQSAELMEGQSPLTSLRLATFLSITGGGDALVPWLDMRGIFTIAGGLAATAFLLTIIALGLQALYQKGKTEATFLAVVTSGGVIIAYSAAWLVMPYGFLPDRYIAYGAPVLLPVFLACALEGFARQFAARWRYMHALVLALPVLILGANGLHVIDDTPLLHGDLKWMRIAPELQQALKQLPDDTVIAGWPDDMLDNVAYLTRKPTWLHYETHQAYHTGYTLEERRRMMLLIDALFSPDPLAVERLRQEGVTHLLVRRSLYNRPEPPHYFSPFDEYLNAHWKEWHEQTPALLALPSVSRIYEYHDWVLISLLPSAPMGTPAPASHAPSGTLMVDASAFIHQLPKGDTLIDNASLHGADKLFDNAAILLGSKEDAIASVSVKEAGIYYLFVRSLGGSESSFSVSINGKPATHLFGHGALKLESGGSFTLPKGKTEIRVGDILPSPLFDAVVLSKNPHVRESDLWAMQFPENVQLLKEYHIPPAASVHFGLIDGKQMGFAVVMPDWSLAVFDHAGHELWRYSAPLENTSLRAQANGPCLIWDFSQKGHADIVHWRMIDGKEWLVVADGETGAIKNKTPWPAMPDLPHAYSNFHLAVARLRPGYPRDIAALTDTGEATSITAYGPDLSPLWAYNGPPAVGALGRALYPIPTGNTDSIAASHVMLNAQGKLLWSHPEAIADHRARMNDIQSVSYGKQHGLLVAQDDDGVAVYDAAHGELLWQNPANNARQVALSADPAAPIIISSHTYEDNRGTPSPYAQLYWFTPEGKMLYAWPQNALAFMPILAAGNWRGDGSMMFFWGSFGINPDHTGTLYFADPIYRVFDFESNGADQAITLDKPAGLMRIYGWRNVTPRAAKRDVSTMRSIANESAEEK